MSRPSLVSSRVTRWAALVMLFCGSAFGLTVASESPASATWYCNHKASVKSETQATFLGWTQTYITDKVTEEWTSHAEDGCFRWDGWLTTDTAYQNCSSNSAAGFDTWCTSWYDPYQWYYTEAEVDGNNHYYDIGYSQNWHTAAHMYTNATGAFYTSCWVTSGSAPWDFTCTGTWNY